VKALKITTDGKKEVVDVECSDSEKQLDVLYELVEGYIKIIRLSEPFSNFVMIVDDEGLVKEKPINSIATSFYNLERTDWQSYIVGDAVIMRWDPPSDITGLTEDDIVIFETVVPRGWTGIF